MGAEVSEMNSPENRTLGSIHQSIRDWVRVAAISLAVLAGCAVLLVCMAFAWEVRYRGARKAVQETIQQRENVPLPLAPPMRKN